MQYTTEKQNKNISSEQEAHYDLELVRKAQEVYRAYSDKISETNAKHHAVVQYPIHWQFSAVKSEKKIGRS